MELSREVTIVNELGLHARAAAKIVKVVEKAKSKVWILKDAQEVDASSVIDILTLCCVKGTKVQIKIDDESDLDILNNIVDQVSRGFRE